MSRLFLPYFESSSLWKYLDGVSTAIGKRMLRGSQTNEENLTFLLCELLDEGAAGLHTLDYSMEDLRKDIEKSDAGIRLDIGFETHEHTKHFESKYSGADLGIVFEVNHPHLGTYKSAVLLQAKRLFASGNKGKFSLYSEYSSFNHDQFLFLTQLQQKFGVSESIFYMWYNPTSEGFSDEHAQHIRALEAASWVSSRYFGKMHPMFLEDMMYSWNGFGHVSVSQQEDGEVERLWRRTQPAIRLTQLGYIEKEHKSIGIKQLYDKMMDRPLSFQPFANFFLMALAGVRWGSSNDEWIKLAQGNKIELVSLQKKNNSNDGPNLFENLRYAPTPKHTLTFSLSSSLPQIG